MDNALQLTHAQNALDCISFTITQKEKFQIN